MFLKKLELFGFKSFADKTEFVFEPGIACIVGPNGCGKSNIVDAVKWCLGDQSPKSLRGDQMTDVIFNGAEGRAALNMAEVTLIFDNEDFALHSEYPEIMVTRRLSRSGESEYLINKQPARLKDVRELFLDTGVGVQAYSIVEQGRIASLLSANSVERRVVFEEAAGISKYKARRNEAMRKLERVEANLLRVTDIIEEVNRQLRSTKRQAGIARRYREHLDSIRDMRLALSARNYEQAREKERQFRDRFEELDGMIEVQGTQLDELGTVVRDTEIEMMRVEHDISDFRERLAELRGNADTSEGEIRGGEELIRELRAGRGQSQSRLDACKRRRSEIAEQVEQARRILEETRVEIGQARAQQDELTAVRGEIEKKHNENEMRLTERKAEVVDSMQRESKMTNEKSSLDAEGRMLEGRAVRMREAQRTLEAEHTEMKAFLAQVEKQIAAQETSIAGRSRELAATKRQLDEQRISHDYKRSYAERLSAELTARRSKAEVLEQQEAAMEGMREGVRTLLDPPNADAGKGEITGVVGPLANLIEVDVQYSAAIENALGDAAQWLIAETTQAARNAVNYLKETGRGRATLLSREIMERRTTVPADLPQGDCEVKRASELVRCADEHRATVRMLLDNVLVVRDLDAAVRLVRDEGCRLRVVTLDGETVEPDGAITGGAKAAGIISRRSELRSLHDEIARLSYSLDAMNREMGWQRRIIGALEERRNALQAELDTCNMSRNEFAAERKSTAARFAETSEEIRLNTGELAEIEADIETKKRRGEELRVELARVSAERESAAQEISALEENLDATYRTLAENAERLTAGKVRLAQLEGKLENVTRDGRRLEREAAESEKEEADIVGQLEDSAFRIEETEESVAEGRERVELLRRQCADQERVVAARQEKREAVKARLEERRKHAREINLRLNGLRREHEDARMTLAQAGNEAEAVVTKIREDYEIDLLEKLPGFEGEEIDTETLLRSIDELKAKIQRMGNVNLSALDELEELQGRSDFLTAQVNDLNSGKMKLQEVIRTINRESRARFEETFGLIREQFRAVFRRLFGGGKADIVLEEGKDVLDAGIDIVAQPPGKEMRTITLMSGGEKVLTAIAVLFSLFKARPSPFAILDEVDAALDDTNIGRFLGMLGDFADKSQFMIISHNKQTMSAANVLYGITMQQSGISKKMEVKLEEFESQVA